MRFLVDENVPRSIGLYLRTMGEDVMLVHDSSLIGSNDKELWKVAVDEQRIIITHDKDFPIPNAVGLPAGVILIRTHNQRPSHIINMFKIGHH